MRILTNLRQILSKIVKFYGFCQWLTIHEHTEILQKVRKSFLKKNRGMVAGGQGFEPRQAESESAVLPLDDPPALWDLRPIK